MSEVEVTSLTAYQNLPKGRSIWHKAWRSITKNKASLLALGVICGARLRGGYFTTSYSA